MRLLRQRTGGPQKVIPAGPPGAAREIYVLYQAPAFQGAAISRISTLAPGRTTPGHSQAISTARSEFSAATTMYPPTISLASEKGPSVTPDAVRILPPGFSLPPRSTMLSLNLSFQALNAACISCIWAGEGGSCFPGEFLRKTSISALPSMLLVGAYSMST